MAWITDSLRTALSAIGRLGRDYGPSTALPTVFSYQLALAAYMSSGMMRKVIAIPAEDRVREWRDWQADKDQIEAIETEERRLGLQAKTKFAEVLRGIGGGAMILITAGDHASELKPDSIRKGGLLAINVVSRWQIRGTDWVRDLADPDYGVPRMFEVNSEKGVPTKIHPSRVVCFRGDPVPPGAGVNDEDSFWGDCRLLRVFTEVTRSDETQAWFSELVRKAKLLRIGIPNIMDLVATEDGRSKLKARIQTIAESESVLNAVTYDAGDGKDNGGEKITDYQITWAGIPAVMDSFDQRVSTVSDIPFTRLTGRSPAGMNATGQHDMDNWNKSVKSGQMLETRPCLEKIDPCLLRSAGVDSAKVTWAFAPLDVPSEKEQADTFNVTMTAVTALQNTGAIPDEAFSKGLQNLMSEREWMPGLDQALAEIPEAERFGIQQDPSVIDPNADPSAIVQTPNGGKEAIQASAGGGKRKAPAGRANDGGAPTGGPPFVDARTYIRWPAGSKRAGQFAPKGAGGFIRDLLFGAPSNASAIEQSTGVMVAHLIRNARAHDLNHAARFSKSGRIPPSRAVLQNYALHAAKAHSFRVAGKRGHGSGLRLRSEILVGSRHYTLVERVGERSGTLSFVTMWENG